MSEETKVDEALVERLIEYFDRNGYPQAVNQFVALLNERRHRNAEAAPPSVLEALQVAFIVWMRKEHPEWSEAWSCNGVDSRGIAAGRYMEPEPQAAWLVWIACAEQADALFAAEAAEGRAKGEAERNRRFVSAVFDFFGDAKIEADIDGDADEEGRAVVYANYDIRASFSSVQRLVEVWHGARLYTDDPLEGLMRIVEGEELPPQPPAVEGAGLMLWRYRMHPDAFGGPTKPWVYTEVKPTNVRGMVELERLSMIATPPPSTPDREAEGRDAARSLQEQMHWHQAQAARLAQQICGDPRKGASTPRSKS